MELSNSLVWALESYDISGIKVLCDPSIGEEVAHCFLTTFTKGWNEALEKVAAAYGDAIPADIPAEICPKDDGFFISIGSMEIIRSAVPCLIKSE